MPATLAGPFVSVYGGSSDGGAPHVEARYSLGGTDDIRCDSGPLTGDTAELCRQFVAGTCPRGVLADWFEDDLSRLGNIPETLRAVVVERLRAQGGR